MSCNTNTISARTSHGYTIQSGNSVHMSSVVSSDLTSAKSKDTWERQPHSDLLFAGYVDAATSFAQNCGGGGSAPDQDWGRDKNEDDILWARRCFRKAREMVTTPVIRWGRRR